jgi:multidrug transporter EmrE-like cation transporter
MSRTVQINGITVASVASKLSLIISATAAFFLYQSETATFTKIVGIAIAVIAVILASLKSGNKTEKAVTKWFYIFPAAVLLMGGTIEIIVKYNETHYLEAIQINSFLIFLFGVAFAIGALIETGNVIRKKHKVLRKNIVAGIILGIPNYGSIYFLIKALNQPGWESSTVFPVNNIAIVALSALVAVLLFREKLSRLNVAGLGLAILAIALIAL